MQYKNTEIYTKRKSKRYEKKTKEKDKGTARQ
jgi:hypothetical protein